MLSIIYSYLLYITCIYSFKNNLLFVNNKFKKKLFMKPHDMIDYLTSIKDYTIITVDDKNKVLQDQMINNDMNVYYVNLNNIMDKNEILNILINKYKHLDTGENLWIFHKGYFFGSREDVYKIISKKNI
jgi:hypothetical protein